MEPAKNALNIRDSKVMGKSAALTTVQTPKEPISTVSVSHVDSYLGDQEMELDVFKIHVIEISCKYWERWVDAKLVQLDRDQMSQAVFANKFHVLNTLVQSIKFADLTIAQFYKGSCEMAPVRNVHHIRDRRVMVRFVAQISVRILQLKSIPSKVNAKDVKHIPGLMSLEENAFTILVLIDKF